MSGSLLSRTFPDRRVADFFDPTRAERRRSADSHDVDIHGAITLKVDGQVVIQPRTDWTRSDWARLDEASATQQAGAHK